MVDTSVEGGYEFGEEIPSGLVCSGSPDQLMGIRTTEAAAPAVTEPKVCVTGRLSAGQSTWAVYGQTLVSHPKQRLL